MNGGHWKFALMLGALIPNAAIAGNVSSEEARIASVSINDFVLQLEESTEALPESCANACSIDPGLNDLAFAFKRNAVPWDRSGCAKMSADEVCTQAIIGCAFTAEIGSGNCIITSPSRLAKRMTSKAFQKKHFRRIQEIFSSLTQSKEMALFCCGEGNPACQRRFSQTSLRVLTDFPAYDQTAYYKLSTHSIYISEPLLISMGTEEVLEATLYHELGHACNYSRHGKLDQKFLLASCTFDGAAIPDMIDTVGMRTSECLQNSLKKAAKERIKNKEGPVCFGQWLKEAYADAVFGFRRNRLDHWVWNCLSVTDTLHGPTSAVMECIFKRTRPMSAFCPREEK